MSELGTTDHLLEAMGDDAYVYTQKHLRTVIEAAKREAVDNPRFQTIARNAAREARGD